MREVVLPSGAKLEISLAPFAAGKALLNAVLEEAKTLKMDASTNIDINLFKDLFCAGFSSKKIELAHAECMKRCLYNGLPIKEETFEPAEARQDFLMVYFEVAKENLEPFTKALTPQYLAILGNLKSFPA